MKLKSLLAETLLKEALTPLDKKAVQHFFDGKPFDPQNDFVHIGYMPEERGLYKKMKIGEQALYLAQLKGMSKADALKSLKYWFEKFEIQGWWDKKVKLTDRIIL
jgi:ABC-2 type transport system ATP-binding protein